MWNFMSSKPEVFTRSNVEGIQRVREGQGKYAFLMESSSIEYIIERNCDLAKVGGKLDSKSYGIALRKNSPHTSEVNQAILQLQENGVLHRLKTKWWKQKGARNCQALRNMPKGASPLTLHNLLGAFLVLILGLAAISCVAAMEFLWGYRKILSNQNADKVCHLKNEVVSSFGRRGNYH